MNQILSLTENAITYKESTQCDVPTTEWNDWKTLFLKSAVLPSPLQPSTLTSTEDATKEDEIIADKVIRYRQVSIIQKVHKAFSSVIKIDSTNLFISLFWSTLMKMVNGKA